MTFSNVAAPNEDYLALYKQSVTTSSSLGSGTFTPKYGGIGGWQHTVAVSSTKRTRLDYFAFGSATPITNMPRSGIVKFFLTGSGNYASNDELFFTFQTDAITVDFDKGTISGGITLTGTNFFNSGSGGIIGFNISGAIAGNTVDAPVSSSRADVTGTFHLLFVGPNADEMIVTYVAQGSFLAAVGSSIGVRDPYLN